MPFIFPQKYRAVTHAKLILFVALLSLVIFISCSEKPSGVDLEQSGNSGNTTIDPNTMDDFLLGSLEGGDIIAGRIEIWGVNLIVDPDSNTVAFDVIIVNRSEHPIFPPLHLVITSIIPPDVFLMNPDGRDDAGSPYIDFSAKLGPDSLLTPNERSEPAHLVFHTDPPKSFMIGYRLDFGSGGPAGIIAGMVFFDLNGNGSRERCEPGIPNMLVTLESHASSSLFIKKATRTGRNGSYSFNHLPGGIYSVEASVLPGWMSTTPNPVLVTLIGDQEKLLGVLFGMLNTYISAELTLFGPVGVGPFSRFGTELDSTFVAPTDSCLITPIPTFPNFLDVRYPMIMGPFPLEITNVDVFINGTSIYHYNVEEDSSLTGPPAGEFPIDYGIVQPGENHIHIELEGGPYALLFFRVFEKLTPRKKDN